MGLFSALFAGVNGINSNGNVISVIGDNIANVNTIGFKGSRAEFEDILAGGSQGLGSRVSDISALHTQGGFESSSNVTDMAVDGKGFFVLSNPNDGSTVYTRAGQFTIDKDGFIVNGDGYRLQGFTFNTTTDEFTSEVADIVISQTPTAPSATEEVEAAMNLSSNETVLAAFDPQNPVTTSNFSAGVTVYDSLGNDHLVTVYYRKVSANLWEWAALVAGSEVGVTTTYAEEATGFLEFNTDGTLLSSIVSTNDFDFSGATANQSITFDFGSDTSGGGTGLDGITQFGNDSSITNISQDGFASGSLKSIEVGSDGSITGNFTNGTTQNIMQVVLASFSNQNALQRIGSNNYIETLESGQPVLGSPESAGKGAVVSSTLEQSNVDLASELIRMVIIQRGFQANSRTISTVNDLLAQLVTLGQ